MAHFIIRVFLLSLAFIQISGDSDETFCVTYADGEYCGDGHDIELTRINGRKKGFVQTISIEDGRDLSMTTVSTNPLVLEIENFLTPSECDHFVNAAEQKGLLKSDKTSVIKPGQFIGKDINRDNKLSIEEMRWTIQIAFDVFMDEDDIRKMYDEKGWDLNRDEIISEDEMMLFTDKDLQSYINAVLEKHPEKHGRMHQYAWLHKNNTDETFSKVQERVAKVSSLPLELMRMAELQVVKYGLKGHFNAHLDSTDEPNMQCCTTENNSTCRICRYMTVMFYLNDVEEGGETAFPVANNITLDVMKILKNGLLNLYKTCENSNVIVKPSKGKALIWYNNFINEQTGWLGIPNVLSLHGGCEVKKGTKWIANMWVKTTADKYYDLQMMQKFYKPRTEKNRPIKEDL